MKLLGLFLAAVILSCSLAVNASSTKYYFEDRNGDEVEILLIDGVIHPRTVGFVQDCTMNNCDDLESIKLKVYDFVVSVQRRKIYTYKLVVNECMNPFGCDAIQSIGDSEYIGSRNNSQHPIQPATRSRKKVYVEEAVKGYINGVTSKIGSQSTEAISNYLISDNSKRSAIVIIKEESGSPVAACEIDNTGCTIIDEIIFTKSPNGRISVGMTVDPYESEKTNLYQNSLESYMLSIQGTWRCVNTGTGSDGHIKWSMTCGYWP